MIYNDLYIKVGSSFIRRELKDLIYIEARNSYSTLNTKMETFTVHFTLNGIEKLLPPEIFIRVHPNFIVNKVMIKTFRENSLDLIVGEIIKTLPLDLSSRNFLLDEKLESDSTVSPTCSHLL